MIPQRPEPSHASLVHQFNMLASGEADFSLFSLPLQHGLAQTFDFSPALEWAKTVIVSRKETVDLSGNFLSGMFDPMTYIAVLMSIFLMQYFMVLRWRITLIKSFLDLVHIFFNNGFGVVSKGKDTTDLRTKLVFAACFGCQFLLASCFKGQMVSQLLNVGQVKNIDTLDDLVARPELKIILLRGTSYHTEFMKFRETTFIPTELDPDPRAYIKVWPGLL